VILLNVDQVLSLDDFDASVQATESLALSA